MKQRFIPILFSTPMVQALLDGRKTQTRRVVKFPKRALQEIEDSEDNEITLTRMQDGFKDGVRAVWGCDDESNWFSMSLPYHVGDILWVRETFVPPLGYGTNTRYFYKADGDLPEPRGDRFDVRWKPSIFMPKVACRLFLEVVYVRLERVQDISEADAVAEGLKLCPNMNRNEGVTGYVFPASPYDKAGLCHSMAATAYSEGWEQINGRESWAANPWVWVVTFEVVEKPDGFC